MNNNLLFSVIIPTKNRQEILFKTLYALIEATKNIAVEIIVINDGDEILFPELIIQKIQTFKNPKAGVASARNFGASITKSNFFLFLDDDVLLSETNVQAIQRIINQDDKNCYNLNWIYPPELSEKISKEQFGRFLNKYGYTTMKGWNVGQFWDDNSVFETSGIASFCLLISKKTFNAVSGYDESFPLAGFEDFDLSERLKAKGVRFFIDPLTMVYHNEENNTVLENWLFRRKRGAITRAHAIKLGYTQLQLNYGIKGFIYHLFSYFKRFLFFLIKIIPNNSFFDIFYNRIVLLLFAIYFYEGYTKETE